MRKLMLALIAVAPFTPAVAQAADLATEARVVRAVPIYKDVSVYRGLGAYQDSGWAYEVPVYRGCEVRIIQTPYGINRIRRCP
jgi:hypothetical protein